MTPKLTLFSSAETSVSGAWESPGIAQKTDFQALSVREGSAFKVLAASFLESAGATFTRQPFELEGIPVDGEIQSRHGQSFLVLARGTPDQKKRSGLRRTDTVEKVGFKAMRLATRTEKPILIVTSDLPSPKSKAGLYLSELADTVWDVVAVRGDVRGFQRLHRHLNERLPMSSPNAPWRGSSWREHPNPYQQPFDFPIEQSAERSVG